MAVAAVVWPLEAIAIRELGLAIDAAIEDRNQAEGTAHHAAASKLVEGLEARLTGKAAEVLGRPVRSLDDLLIRATLSLAFADKAPSGRPVVDQRYAVDRAVSGLVEGVFELLEPRALPISA